MTHQPDKRITRYEEAGQVWEMQGFHRTRYGYTACYCVEMRGTMEGYFHPGTEILQAATQQDGWVRYWYVPETARARDVLNLMVEIDEHNDRTEQLG